MCARAAARKPCANCPWRLSNQGKRHPSGWYTKRNLRRLWQGLKRGEAMSCHPTDPNNPVGPEDEAAGHRPAPEGMDPRECAGALVLVQREVEVFQAVARQRDEEEPGAKDGLRAYRRLRPRGMTQEGLAEVVSRVLFGGTPFGGADMTTPDLNDADIGHPDLTWPPEGVRLPAGLGPS
jgi:hypothetical protein